jgi:phenylpyruvate tautomerase PptA (4-oxalocrotonate tautomerase family)
LTLGLFLVCLGLFWFAGVVKDLSYGPMIGGMLLTGIGAGFLNGETTKVGMTAIPKERSGMASGVSGTVRFSGLVIGIAAFGAVLYGGVAAAVRQALPDATASDGLRLVRDITAGHLGDVTLAGHNAGEIQALAAVSFAGGYQWLFLAAALFMLVSTLLTWRLVSAAETPPVSVSAEAPSRQVLRLLQPSRDHHPAHVKPQTCENLAANEGEMPTYTVTTANLTLTPAQESAIAAAITDAHHDNTGAPGFFAQVLFVALPERKHYIGGKLNKIPHIFVHGLIRAGRNADAKAGLIREITSNAREVSGVGAEDIWVYVQDIPAEQMVEFGRVLPEPGAEARWREGLSSSKRQELAAAGVTIWGPGET